MQIIKKECTADELIAFMYQINFLNARKGAADGDVDRKYFEDNRYVTAKGVDFGYDWEVYPLFGEPYILKQKIYSDIQTFRIIFNFEKYVSWKTFNYSVIGKKSVRE